MTLKRGIKDAERLPRSVPAEVILAAQSAAKWLLLHTCLPSNMEITPLTRDCCIFHEQLGHFILF